MMIFVLPSPTSITFSEMEYDWDLSSWAARSPSLSPAMGWGWQMCLCTPVNGLTP